MKTHRIALIPADGIGPEVLAAGWRVLEAPALHHDFALHGETFSWSCDFYVKTGRMMAEDGIDKLRRFDAIYLGVVGWPCQGARRRIGAQAAAADPQGIRPVRRCECRIGSESTATRSHN